MQDAVELPMPNTANINLVTARKKRPAQLQARYDCSDADDDEYDKDGKVRTLDTRFRMNGFSWI